MVQRSHLHRVTRRMLVSQVAAELDQPQADVDATVEMFLKKLVAAIGSRQSVTLSRDGLGRFDVVKQAPRNVMNPRTHQLMEVPAKWRVSFRASEQLKNQLKKEGREI